MRGSNTSSIIKVLFDNLRCRPRYSEDATGTSRQPLDSLSSPDIPSGVVASPVAITDVSHPEHGQ